MAPRRHNRKREPETPQVVSNAVTPHRFANDLHRDATLETVDSEPWNKGRSYDLQKKLDRYEESLAKNWGNIRTL